MSRAEARRERHVRLRKKVAGTAERPRLFVRRTLHHIYAALVDDVKGHTLASVSTLDTSVGASLASKSNLGAAQAVGGAIAGKAKAAGISAVVFDRGGYKYHGRVRALADAAREAGLTF
ncbi:MAG TPA: 50S ribosomal protein L18 [Candidatus Cybelea sp.]|jgi:large subunit ribosomal protein L18|nr:50S ribosomal protein L18 [Candidatus Cybelea sp.]